MSEANCITENRLGRFVVTRSMLLTGDDEKLLDFFGKFIVISCKKRGNLYEYLAYSPLFLSIAMNIEPPHYALVTTVDNTSGEEIVTFKMELVEDW